MAISLPPDLVEDLYRYPSLAGFVISADSDQRHAVREALRAVERRGFDEIPYPDDPGQGPLASYSDFSVQIDGCGLTFDMPNAEAYRTDTTPVTVHAGTMGAAESYGIDQPMERLVAILVEELAANGVVDCAVKRFPVPS